MEKRDYRIIKKDTHMKLLRLIDCETGECFLWKLPLISNADDFSCGSVISIDKKVMAIDREKVAREDKKREDAKKAYESSKVIYKKSCNAFESMKKERERSKELIKLIKKAI